MDSNKEQFSQIYDQYIEKIYRFVYLKVDSQEAAEDITSKVFLKGWEAYDSQTSINNVRAFLYQVSRNMVTDYYRERSRTKLISPDVVPQIADNRASVYEKAVLSSDIERIKTAIRNIKKEYQDVLILHYLEDMPTDEIAGILNKPAGTVRVMIHRGLKSLRGQLVRKG